jgi:hypothetical protein
MDIHLIDEPCYLNLKPETSNIFFKLMEESYVALPQSLGLCRVAGAESKGGLNQDRLKVMLFIVTSLRRRIRLVSANEHSPEGRFRQELQR